MARADAKGLARYLPTAVQSALGVVALSAIVCGAAVQRRRRRAGSSGTDGVSNTPWATSGSTGQQQGTDD